LGAASSRTMIVITMAMMASLKASSLPLLKIHLYGTAERPNGIELSRPDLLEPRGPRGPRF
jgi:hypothetical protein